MATRRQQRGGRRVPARMTPIETEKTETPPPEEPATDKADDNGIPSDAWWVFVMPSSEGAPAPIPGGRYGYWALKPKVEQDEFGWTITPVNSDYTVKEPTLFIERHLTITVYVAQMKHTINPTPPTAEPGAMTPV